MPPKCSLPGLAALAAAAALSLSLSVVTSCRALSGTITLDLEKVSRLEELFREKNAAESELEHLEALPAVALSAADEKRIEAERVYRMAELLVTLSEIERLVGTRPRSRFIPPESAEEPSDGG